MADIAWVDWAQIIGLIILGFVQLMEFFIVYKMNKNQQEQKAEGDKNKWLS